MPRFVCLTRTPPAPASRGSGTEWFSVYFILLTLIVFGHCKLLKQLLWDAADSLHGEREIVLEIVPAYTVPWLFMQSLLSKMGVCVCVCIIRFTPLTLQSARCDIWVFGDVYEQWLHTHHFHLVLPHSPPHPSLPVLHMSLHSLSLPHSVKC